MLQQTAAILQRVRNHYKVKRAYWRPKNVEHYCAIRAGKNGIYHLDTEAVKDRWGRMEDYEYVDIDDYSVVPDTAFVLRGLPL